MKKNAFTLAEIYVVLIAIGALAVITISALTRAIPDKTIVMAKKANQTLTQTVQEMLNDDTSCPYSDDNPGLKNCVDNNGGGNGFAENFVSKLNTIEENGNKTQFTTTDGIQWIIPAQLGDGEYQITVDVNNTKEPNCFYIDGNCPQPDRFIFNLRYDGKITIPEGDIRLQEYLITNDLKKRTD